MTVENQTGGAGDQDQNGGANNSNQDDQNNNSQSDVVSKADHQRAIDDMHRFKKSAKDLESKVNELTSQIESIKVNSAKTNDDYKALWEQEKTKRETIENSHTQMKSSLLNSERYRAVEPKLRKMGLTDEALKLVEYEKLDDIGVEATSSGRFIVDDKSVDDFCQMFSAKHPYGFVKQGVRDLNSNIPRGVNGGSEWTPDSLVKLEIECKKKGDLEPYRKAVAEWKQSRK